MPQRVLSIDWDWYFKGADGISGNCGACSWYKARACSGGGGPLDKRPKRPSLGHNCNKSNFSVSRHEGIAIEQLSRFISSSAIKGADVMVAECHADIYAVLNDRDSVVNLDAHHDDFNCGDVLCCGNWVTLARANKHIAYQWGNSPNATELQQWKYTTKQSRDLALRCKEIPVTRPSSTKFQMVFICQSSPWTPAQQDRDFVKLCRDVATAAGSPLMVLGSGKHNMAKLLQA